MKNSPPPCSCTTGQAVSLKKYRVLGLILAVIAPTLVCAAAVDQGTAQSTTPAAEGLQRRPLGLDGSTTSANEQYLIGAGDEVAVSVVGRPELSGTQTVGPDGRITVPVAGSVVVGEKSREDAAKAVDEALSKYYSGAISSTVQVTKYGSNHILLLGAVEHPGVISFDQPPSLLEAITKGGQVVNPDKTTQTARKCIIYRGDNEVMSVNISEKFDGQKALNDIRLKRNDIVYIPEHQESIVSVLGEVTHPGPVPLLPSSTLISLLASAGDITEKAGSNPLISITEPSTGKIQQIRFNELRTVHGGTDIALHDGDIVFVPRSGLAKTGFFFQQLGPVFGIGTLLTIAK